MDEFMNSTNTYFYDATPNLNKYATEGSEFANVSITKNPQLLIKLASTDITANEIIVNINGFKFDVPDSHKRSTGQLLTPVAQVTEENVAPYTVKPTWNKVEHADYYEIEFNDMLYTTIKNTEILFENLEAETRYSFKIRAVNKDGFSDWKEFSVTTLSNPLEFAIPNIKGETSVPNQGGAGIHKLFDFAESGDTWHTRYGMKAIPFDIIMDLQTINQLDKFNYLPRMDAGNGTLLKGSVYYSMDKQNWIEAGSFEWVRDNAVKQFKFTDHPSARYIRLSVNESVGNYGSGRELYVFKVPGTESYLPGDINNDGLIDHNDLTSYMNYTGLRKGDPDFEGYISNGDINKNNLIDAYDISVVATQLDGGVKPSIPKVNGHIEISTSKQAYNKGEVIEINVNGVNLQAVNALSFALPYDQDDYEFITVEPINMKKMENLTRDRLHSNGQKAIYPTFVNLGDQEPLEGSMKLFVIKLKAKRKVRFDLKAIDGILVNKNLNTLQVFK